MSRVSALVRVVAAGAVALGGCTSVRTGAESSSPGPRGCEGCVLVDVQIIDIDEALRSLGVECPLPDEEEK